MRSGTGWLILLGALLLGGVISWQLLSGSYSADIATICSAEKKSGFTVTSDQKKMNDWVSTRLDTPQGNVFFNDLITKRLSDRAKTLHDAAINAKLNECALVDSYEALQTESDYQADLTTFCASDGDMPGLKYLEEADRTQKLKTWFSTKAKTPQMKAFGAKLLAVPQSQRAQLLRTETNAHIIYVCSLTDLIGAAAIERPRPGAFVQISQPLIVGDVRAADVTKALATKVPDIEDCYRTALKTNPKEVGKLLEKIELAPGAKIVKVADAGFVFDKDVATCVHALLQTMTLPPTTGMLSTITIPMDFQPPKPEDPEGPNGLGPPRTE